MATQSPLLGQPSVEKEIRFAVVMYGGVSLAIYINGVAQELNNMVSATARKQNEDGSPGDYFRAETKSTETVYRMLGEVLRARFVVDILSGTSAGGINAIFLAKALANNQPMAQLQKLWEEEGDIELLINDKKSFTGLSGLQLKPPPTSLLNSQRMYYRLLKAFNGMDEAAPRSRGEKSPLVDELDLYVTATDIRGLWLPVPLADREAHEYRYRSVFRFYHATTEAKEDWSQDFLQENNPFLAFAARATSSFPFAFEPINLKHVDQVLTGGGFVRREAELTALRTGWQRFYKDYSRDPDNIDHHFFGDGGYLDNKPFSYITETLQRRRSDTPVDRRLFYIEPAPEHPKQKVDAEVEPPDAVENVMAALVSLPRYETIRDDLLQLKTRNDLIERTTAILRQIERTRGGVDKLKIWSGKGVDWSSKYLDEIVSKYGAGYAAYHQLRVADTLDEFAKAVARNIGMEEEGRSFNLLRQIFEQWRRLTYSSNSQDKRYTENDLLFRLDLSWRVRRLHFLTNLIDDILLGLNTFHDGSGDPNLPLAAREQMDYARELVRKSGVIWEIPDEAAENQYFEVLSALKRQFNKAYMELRTRGRKLRARNLARRDVKTLDDDDLKKHVQLLQPLCEIKDHVEEIICNEARLTAVCEQIEALSLGLSSRFEQGKKSTGYLCQTMTVVSQMSKEALSGKSLPGVPKAVLNNVQDCLRFYYDYFEYFDMLTFPITYATPIGESDVVDVYRISPEDALGLFSAEKNERPKLAGTKLGNFGAFFKKEWRQNDIMWGRLDGAERIISTLLPDSPKRTELLLKAWLAILDENLDSVNKSNLGAYLGSLREDFEKTGEPSVQQMGALQEALQKYFAERYLLDLEFSPKITVDALGRSVGVLGSLLDGLGQKYQAAQTPAFWLTRLGKIFMGVMQVAIPGSLPGMFFQHWIKVVYVFEIFLIIAGSLLGFSNTATRFGIFSLLFTLSIDLAVRLVGSYITGSKAVTGIVRGIAKVIVTLVLLALIGLVYLGLVYLGVASLPNLKIFGP